MAERTRSTAGTGGSASGRRSDGSITILSVGLVANIGRHTLSRTGVLRKRCARVSFDDGAVSLKKVPCWKGFASVGAQTSSVSSFIEDRGRWEKICLRKAG